MRLSLFALLLCLAPIAMAAEPATYGAPLPADGTAVPISVASADVDAYAGTPHRFSGRITEVCQKEGCWMMLENDGQAARVLMHDHAFAVPKDARGNAEVYGVLSVKELSEEAAGHLAEDSGKNVLPSLRELRIDATGVRIE